MPEKVETFEFRNFGPRGKDDTQHNWDELLDGGIYKCMEGTDFKVKKLTFMNLARDQAKKRGLRLRTGSVEGGIVIQAMPGDGTEGSEPNGVANGTATEPPTPVPAPVPKPTVTTAPKPVGGPAAKPPVGGPKAAGRK